MIDKRQVGEALEEKLEKVRDRIAELTKELDAFQTDINENNNKAQAQSELELMKSFIRTVSKEVIDALKVLIKIRNKYPMFRLKTKEELKRDIQSKMVELYQERQRLSVEYREKVKKIDVELSKLDYRLMNGEY